jgi:hypothetical protein
MEELRSWYIANRDWLGQGTRLILAAKSLRVRGCWRRCSCWVERVYVFVCVWWWGGGGSREFVDARTFIPCWRDQSSIINLLPTYPITHMHTHAHAHTYNTHRQLSWLKDYAESKRWLEALKVYRTVECAVSAPLQQVRGGHI